jgi:hypothetical protein
MGPVLPAAGGQPRVKTWRLLLGALILWGCAGTPVPPAYTQAELAERCVRTGGWWRGEEPDSLYSGHCEYRD